ncbi:flagellar brake protein [Shewanella maritima]|uniref:flagellar brake protein n=1 Tax=Shewanella maritima TaxID=2520507 RepID=UPI003737053A
MATKRVNTQNGLSKEFNFLAGTPINIDIVTPAGQKGRFRTTFIGYLPGEFVLIQFPDLNKLGSYAQYFVNGTELTVRGLIEGHEASVIAFVSTIKQTLTVPTRMVALNFPKELTVHNLRATKRVLTELPTTVSLEPQQWSALMSDISLMGCHLIVNKCSDEDIEEGAKITITVKDNDENNISITAVVCNKKSKGTNIEFGCQFTEQQDDKIEKMIHMALLVEK